MIKIEKTVVVLPAYNAAATLKETLREVSASFPQIVLCDDFSSDDTVKIAKELGLTVLEHDQNYGYGRNQKTLYNYVLGKDFEYVVMLHPDNQYDTSVLPRIVDLLEQGDDIVLGNRMGATSAKEGEMPWWKQIGNRFLSRVQRRVFRVELGEFHTGLRGYRAGFLRSIPIDEFSDGFVFDSQLLAYAFSKKAKISQVDVNCYYHKDASSVGLWESVKYGFGTLWVVIKYMFRS